MPYLLDTDVLTVATRNRSDFKASGAPIVNPFDC